MIKRYISLMRTQFSALIYRRCTFDTNCCL